MLPKAGLSPIGTNSFLGVKLLIPGCVLHQRLQILWVLNYSV
jgi:hypothetical protein